MPPPMRDTSAAAAACSDASVATSMMGSRASGPMHPLETEYRMRAGPPKPPRLLSITPSLASASRLGHSLFGQTLELQGRRHVLVGIGVGQIDRHDGALAGRPPAAAAGPRP